jgi:hypothetical protein
VSFAIFFTAVFLVIMQKNYTEAKQITDENQVAQLMRLISSEISLAETSPNGYMRTFYVPTTINGEYYNVSSTDGVDVVFRYNGRIYVYYLANTSLDEAHCATVDAEGNSNCLLSTGFNTIKKTCQPPPNRHCTLDLLQNT